jgi:uncharacterized protein YjbI with pentapeptide repeats
MPSSPAEVPAESAFVCDCDEDMRPACENEPFYKEYEGKRYCVFHYPGEEKIEEFNAAFLNKEVTGDNNFRGLWFPKEVSMYKTNATGGDFSRAVFNGPLTCYKTKFSADISFNGATFRGPVRFDRCTFRSYITFEYATFCERVEFIHESSFKTDKTDANVSFNFATFKSEVRFDGCIFGEWVSFGFSKFHARANFRGVRFNRVIFANATFGAGVSFDYATFHHEASFFNADFSDYVRFAGKEKMQSFGEQASLDFHDARVERPERVSFHTLTLCPHWFVNIDARKFEFTNVKWRVDFREELVDLRNRKVESSYRLLSIACRNLAVNAEENHRYEEASKFRYMTMEARRLERWRGFAFWTLGWWYWLASGYGERIGRAFIVLLGILVLFAALYLGLGFPNWGTKTATEKPAVESQGKWSQVSGALLYSADVMMLQKPDPRPTAPIAQWLVRFETILGPVQAALLALAIRRKFMR